MPSMTLKKIDKVQPMREGEVAVVDYLNGDLTKYLEQETSERIAGINEFKGKVEAEQERAQKIEGKITADLAAEVKARKSGDTELSVKVGNEAKLRNIEDGKLSARIDTEVTDRKSGDSALTASLASEASDRKAADTALSSRFPVKTNDITDKSVTLAKLADEVSGKLSGAIDVPMFNYGITDVAKISPNSYLDVTVTINPQITKDYTILLTVSNVALNVIVRLKNAAASSFTARIHNMTSSEVSGTKLNWLCIYERG